MTSVLGISAFYHDSAAVLLVDGKIVAAAQEERFTRKRHDAGFPRQSVNYCLQEAGIDATELDYVGFYDKPLLKFDRLLESYLSVAPRGFPSFMQALPEWLLKKLHIPRILRKELPGFRKRIVFSEHHESHAASAFYPSPFESAAILVADGVGEWATTSLGVGRGAELSLSHEIRFPDSLGLLYSAFTGYCGFRVNSGEYKLMGLAPYGEPRFAGTIRENLVDIKHDGSFRLDQRYFRYIGGLTMTSPRFHELFGGKPRQPESPLTQREMDLAASIQLVTEEIMLALARNLRTTTGERNLCLAGGVALNCVSNGRLLRGAGFDDIWIQPAAGDAGGALGVASHIWHVALKEGRTPGKPDGQAGSLLGPSFSAREVDNYLSSVGAVSVRYPSKEDRLREVSQLLAAQNVIGLFQGRMEFGPRALGSRSIIADPRSSEMQSRLNLKVKLRESFRPFAPAVLAERADEFFQLGNAVSPYMLLTCGVQEKERLSPPEHLEGLARLSAPHSSIPAVTHVNFSARVQTVDNERNPAFHELIQSFEQLTGCPLVVNTSFNVRGEPLVCTPEDAYRCFMATDIDVLVLEDHILLKRDQPSSNRPENHVAQFNLD